MFCRFCGTNLPDDSVFCHTCGKSLGTPASVNPRTSTDGFVVAQPKKSTSRQLMLVTTAVSLVSLAAFFLLRSPRSGRETDARQDLGKAALKAERKPSFDCAKAKSATETAICADGDLASLEVSMVTAYRSALDRLPSAERSDFRRQHAEWFKSYQDSCNAQARTGLKDCISKSLSDHTRDLQASQVNTLPTLVGQCTATTVSRIGTRLTEGVNGPDIPGSGSLISYADGGSQVSYETIPGIENSQVGDKVLLCLVSIPKSCPPGDNRGKVYSARNLRTSAAWRLPDSQHDCGGA